MSAAATAPVAHRASRSLFAFLALIAGILPASSHLQWLATPLALVSILLGWRELRSISRVLLLLVGIFGAAAWLWAPEALIDAAGNAARLVALVIAVMLLSATIGRSRDLAALSADLFSGRPLPRYLAIAFATGVLSVPLNFGSVGVMSSMISRVKEVRGDTAMLRNAARAVLRGFSLASICSPLSIAVAVTLAFLPGLRLPELLAVSFPFAVGFVLLGLAFREEEGPRSAASAQLQERREAGAAPPVLAWLKFACVIVAICAGAVALGTFTQMPYPRAVALSCAAAVAIGLLLSRARGLPSAPPSLANTGNELAIMGGSAFLGALAGHVGLHLLGPDFSLPVSVCPIVAFAIPWLLFLGGMLGINPIVTGTLAGAMLAPIWPPSALLGLGVGMVCGWGLTVAGTPYSANSLLLSRETGYNAMTAALRWNLRLSLVSLLLAGLLAAGLTYLRTAG
ncbi:MAG: hypothetical protein ABI589_00380 [Burkholderiales bacterium]